MIVIKSAVEIEKIKNSGKIVNEVLSKISEEIQPGITTYDINAIAAEIMKKSKARAAFLGYRGYPASVCVSLNEVVVHGIPSRKILLKEGDIVSIDFGVELDGFFGDSAVTVPVGKVSQTAERLIRITKECLFKGIEKAVEGNKLYDISAAVQKHAENNGFSVVRDFVGHGIGRKLHEDPMVPNYGREGTGPELKNGMVLAIEPMINEGGYEVAVQNDEWTVVTVDGKLSGHFEHTIAITDKGPEILT